jgi:hypothetical protein
MDIIGAHVSRARAVVPLYGLSADGVADCGLSLLLAGLASVVCTISSRTAAFLDNVKHDASGS